VSIIYGDALNIRFPQHDRVIANIPFNITEPLITRLMGKGNAPAFLLVGESYASNSESNNSYSTRLGLLTRAYFHVEQLLHIPKEAFVPEPSTDGVLISLHPLKRNSLEKEFPLYSIRCIWDQKTRNVRDALSAAIYQYTAARGAGDVDVSRAMGGLEKDNPQLLRKRVDALTNKEFTDLYHALSGNILRKLYGGHKPRGGAQNWRKTYERYLR